MSEAAQAPLRTSRQTWTAGLVRLVNTMAKSPDTAIYIKLSEPMPHESDSSNANGPIVGIEIGLYEGELVFWSDDGQEGMTAYSSLSELCESYGFDLDAISKQVFVTMLKAQGDSYR